MIDALHDALIDANIDPAVIEFEMPTLSQIAKSHSRVPKAQHAQLHIDAVAEFTTTGPRRPTDKPQPAPVTTPPLQREPSRRGSRRAEVRRHVLRLRVLHGPLRACLVRLHASALVAPRARAVLVELCARQADVRRE